MGTPDFAAISLKRLMKEGDLEISVVTQPDKPQGRHMVLTPSAVKTAALEGGLPLYQPERLKDGAFLETLREIDPEIILVVAYGKILPSYILDYPKYGCINLHGSLLPEYRGAAPMQRMVIDGKKTVGVTTMFMAEGLDTGDMLEKWETPLSDEADFEWVHDTLAENGAELLVSTLRKAEKGQLLPVPQEEALATYAAKILKEDCRLDFSLDARSVHNRIRGLSPVPLSFALHREKTLKIIKSEIVREEGRNDCPGLVLSIKEDGAYIACGQGILKITALRPEGKKAMGAADFARGRGILEGEILS
jgi:methionyl-tRNA formyltransferase